MKHPITSVFKKTFKVYIVVLFIASISLSCFFFYLENIKPKDIILSHYDNFLNYKFINQNQKVISISDFKNKVILVNFWFAGCLPCVKEMKYYPEVLEKYGNEVIILSISIDSKEYLEKILDKKLKPWSFLNKTSNSWHFSNLEKDVVIKLNINSFPTYFIINKKGEIIGSPKSGIYGVEHELNSFVNTPISYKKFLKNIAVQDLKKSFLLFNVLFIIIYLSIGLIFLIRSKIK
jgi:thiol-disulfide isomerase/thioredoxin